MIDKTWTPEYRLKLIRSLIIIEYDNPFPSGDLMQHIMFLCDMPDKFLKANKRNYLDAIKLVKAETEIEL